MNKKKILLELQSLGARIDVPLNDPGRCGGAGPSDDKAFLFDGVPAGSSTTSNKSSLAADDNEGSPEMRLSAICCTFY